jgi:hypothetical protein
VKKCARCGREYQRFEGGIGGEDYCHPDDPNLPDCYTLTHWAESSVTVVHLAPPIWAPEQILEPICGHGEVGDLMTYFDNEATCPACLKLNSGEAPA